VALSQLGGKAVLSDSSALPGRGKGNFAPGGCAETQRPAGDLLSAEYIEGFSWPLPRAFASAVSACRFEQGDVVYSHARAYRAWKGRAPKLDHQIQVLDPPKTTRALAGDGESKRFFANWASPVELEWTAFADASTRTVKTTQGRLFTCLWRGDVGQLDEGSEAPSPPALQRELHKVIENSAAAFRRELEKLDIALAAHSLYIGVVDQSSEASCQKAHKIQVALQEEFVVESVELSPAAAGIECSEGFHPALALRGFAIGTRDVAAIEARLKGVLYAPSTSRQETRQETGEGKTDRFSLARHGLLLDAAD